MNNNIKQQPGPPYPSGTINLPTNKSMVSTVKKNPVCPEILSVSVDFPVVGIGASAGGLAAFEAFFSGMPAETDSGMAFVLVQHLAPDHKSLLTELVQRYTRMQVFEVEDGMKVKPDCAYIIPPGKDLSFKNGRLQLLEQQLPRGQRLPIDYFFRSLAEDLHEKAICIVLSGTGCDGTRGVLDVKAVGGMVMAQYPESTTYDGMPRNAIATGMVDYVLPPAEMPEKLIAHVAHAFGKLADIASAAVPNTDDALNKILLLLQSHTNHDFTQYKEKTVSRRIERRMALHQIEKLDGYLFYLQKNPGEAEALFHDLLIGVTCFFRDPDVFAVLAEQVLPDLFRKKPAGALLRIWVPGCSTGEEAYSIAILLLECMETLGKNFRIQLFATDIDNRSIVIARAGIYPQGIASDISKERQTLFFTPEENNSVFRVNKRVRDMLIFSEQDVIRDPPFSRLDMISCRNLLIYLGSELQKKLIPLFHYALNPGGTLFLGNSETVGNFSDLFTVIDRKAKIYKRSDDVIGMHKQTMTFHFPRSNGTSGQAPSDHFSAANRDELRILTEKAFLQHFSPVGALVNNQGDILYIHGRTGMYLEPSPGEACMNIIQMAREGLRQNLIALLREAGTQKKPVSCCGVKVKTNGDYSTVDVTVRPVTAGSGATATSLLLVIIDKIADVDNNKHCADTTSCLIKDAGSAVSENHQSIIALKQELHVKEEYLQTTIEELNSSNEEMQSINEELQSTNEELETSKEELQSVNEELATVNVELQTRVADLTRTNNDMNNLLAGTGIGTIFVDNKMCIRRFTPAVTSIINLIATDIGRPVNHIVSNLTGYDILMDDIKNVLDDLVPKEDIVQTRAGASYLLRIQPYRTLDNVVEGVVISFIDITKKNNEEYEKP